MRKQNKIGEFNPKYKQQQMMSFLQNYKEDALIRIGNFSTEIVYGKRSFMYPAKAKDNGAYKRGMFLFGMVRRDAKLFLHNGGKVTIPKRYPVNVYNNKFDGWESRITATDLNHAYWRIAYNIGIISKSTYLKGLDDDFKVVRLAALSTLGASKQYAVIKKGIITQEYVNLGGDDELKLLYRAIRYTCYKYMQQIRRFLKTDFVAYRTDCIYYADTGENRKLVQCFCKERSMMYKQLYGDKRPTKD